MALVGVVRRINYRAGLVAIDLWADAYVIADILDDLEHVDRGDVLTGDLGQHGYCRLRNMTKGFDLRAHVNAIGATAADRDTLLA